MIAHMAPFEDRHKGATPALFSGRRFSSDTLSLHIVFV